MILAVYAIFKAADTYLTPGKRLQSHRFVAVALFTVAALFVGQGRITLTADTPRAAADVYDQKYLAGVFLQRYFPHTAVMSGELGWITWLHHGPFVDILGLGDYGVLQELRRTDFAGTPAYWQSLASADGVKVVVIYPQTISWSVPKQWTLVGVWHLHHRRLTALSRQFMFYATTPELVGPLTRDLRSFAPHLPDRESLTLLPSPGN